LIFISYLPPIVGTLSNLRLLASARKLLVKAHLGLLPPIVGTLSNLRLLAPARKLLVKAHLGF